MWSVSVYVITAQRRNQMKSDPNLPQGSTAYDRSSGEFYRYENYVEQGLTNILSLIKDVGEVEVFITLRVQNQY